MYNNQKFLNLVAQLSKNVQEIDVMLLKSLLMQKKDNFVLIDIRELNERQSQGHINQDIHLSKGILERDIAKYVIDNNKKIILYCSGGYRSIIAAYNLLQMDYKQVYSLNGGFKSWQMLLKQQ